MVWIGNPYPEGSPQYVDYMFRQFTMNDMVELQRRQNELLQQMMASLPVGPSPQQGAALQDFVQTTWRLVLRLTEEKHSLAVKSWGLANVLLLIAPEVPVLKQLTPKLITDRQLCASVAVDTAKALRQYGVRPQLDDLAADDQQAVYSHAGT